MSIIITAVANCLLQRFRSDRDVLALSFLKILFPWETILCEVWIDGRWAGRSCIRYHSSCLYRIDHAIVYYILDQATQGTSYYDASVTPFAQQSVRWPRHMPRLLLKDEPDLQTQLKVLVSSRHSKVTKPHRPNLILLVPLVPLQQTRLL